MYGEVNVLLVAFRARFDEDKPVLGEVESVLGEVESVYDEVESDYFGCGREVCGADIWAREKNGVFLRKIRVVVPERQSMQ